MVFGEGQKRRGRAVRVMDEIESVSVAERSLLEHMMRCDQCREAPIVFGLCDEGLVLFQAAAEEGEKDHEED